MPQIGAWRQNPYSGSGFRFSMAALTLPALPQVSAVAGWLNSANFKQSHWQLNLCPGITFLHN
jgi:hypothetical protein